MHYSDIEKTRFRSFLSSFKILFYLGRLGFFKLVDVEIRTESFSRIEFVSTNYVRVES
jgi:hypothetical protein